MVFDVSLCWAGKAYQHRNLQPDYLVDSSRNHREHFGYNKEFFGACEETEAAR